MENLKILSQSFVNKTALFTVILPSFLYMYVTAQFGLGIATIGAAVYSIAIDFAFKTFGNFAYVILATGLIDLAITVWMPAELLASTLALRLQVTALQSVLMLTLFALIKRPIPMLLAEAFAPALKELHKNNPKQYVWIWQKISLFWTIAFVLKAALFQFNFQSDQLFSTLNLITSWPLMVGLIYFGISYGRNEFEKAGWQN